jgi:hypothetical protein
LEPAIEHTPKRLNKSGETAAIEAKQLAALVIQDYLVEAPWEKNSNHEVELFQSADCSVRPVAGSEFGSQAAVLF